MRQETSGGFENGHAADALEETGGMSVETESGAKRFVQLQVFLPRKEAIVLEEIRLRRMKKGQDLSRSRLISEAVRLLVERENSVKEAA